MKQPDPTHTEGGTETWPGLRLMFEFAPWHWRIAYNSDPIERGGTLDLGPLSVEWFLNTPAFKPRR